MRLIEGVETEVFDMGGATLTLPWLEIIAQTVREGKPLLIKNSGKGGVTLMEMGAYLAGLAMDSPTLSVQAKQMIDQWRTR